MEVGWSDQIPIMCAISVSDQLDWRGAWAVAVADVSLTIISIAI